MELAIVSLLIGIVLLIFGRKLFWVFVGLAGFLAGMEIAERFNPGPEPARLLIALGVGILGAVLAVMFYKVAVAIAGFIVGGYLALNALRYFDLSVPQSLSWLPYVIGGIAGLVLILLIFDWALIVLTSMAGASLIVQHGAVQQFNTPIVFFGLVILGILIQAGILLRDRSATI